MNHVPSGYISRDVTVLGYCATVHPHTSVLKALVAWLVSPVITLPHDRVITQYFFQPLFISPQPVLHLVNQLKGLKLFSIPST